VKKRRNISVSLKKGSILYVRIDNKIAGKDMSCEDFSEHLAYVKNIASERYLMGGGFGDVDGGMLLFEARNFEEAEKIACKDPIIVRGIYRYELYEWNLVVLSEDIDSYVG